MLPSLRLLQAFALAALADFTLALPSDVSASHSRSWTVGQNVSTSSGTIIGHAATNTTQVSEYLGIRYAQPPVGSLRFAAPQPYTSNETFTASSFVSSTLNPLSVHSSDHYSLRKLFMPDFFYPVFGYCDEARSTSTSLW